MANIITDLLAKVSPAAQMLNQATGMAKAIQSPNPAAALMSQTDPRMAQVMDFVNQNGGNPEQVFYALAKQKGVDPNEILSTVRSLMSK